MAKRTNDDLSFPVLACIATSPAGTHGYRITATLNERLKLPVRFPSVYRVIDRLEGRGCVNCWWSAAEASYAGGPRKMCQISDAGRALMRQLKAAHREKAELVSAILTYLKENGHDDPGDAADRREPDPPARPTDPHGP